MKTRFVLLAPIVSASLEIDARRDEYQRKLWRLHDQEKKYGTTYANHQRDLDAVEEAEKAIENARLAEMAAKRPLIDWLEEVQTHARVRCINVSHIIETAESASKFLSALGTKKAQIGTTLRVCPHAQTFPSAYKGMPGGTCYTLVLKSNGWRVVSISRDNCDFSSEKRYVFEFPQTLIDEMPTRLAAHFCL